MVSELNKILSQVYLYFLEHNKDESYLRRVIQPLEIILVKHKRIIMKVSNDYFS